MGQNMKAPDKIFVHRDIHLGLLSGSEINITGQDVEYIRKDALLEWWANKFSDSLLPGTTITKYLTNFLESL